MALATIAATLTGCDRTFSSTDTYRISQDVKAVVRRTLEEIFPRGDVAASGGKPACVAAEDLVLLRARSEDVPSGAGHEPGLST